MTPLRPARYLGEPSTWTLVGATIYAFCRCGQANPLPSGSVEPDGRVDHTVRCMDERCGREDEYQLVGFEGQVAT